MICPDVNILLYAFREDTIDHPAYRDWLERTMTGAEPVGISELTLSGVVRIATNHRIFRQPSSTVQVMEFCDSMLTAPTAVSLRPGPRHWAIFRELCVGNSAKANTVPDAYHAALAIEHGATWITSDRGFARFANLKWRGPFD